jgi:hypothetical protein
MAKTAETVNIPAMELRLVQLEIKGDSALVMHKFSEKSIKQIEDKQQKKAKSGRESRNPEEECERSIHRDIDGDICFPANGFKSAAVRAASDVDLKMTDMRRAVHIIGETIKIKGDEPLMRTDTVKIGMGTTDIRYRPQINNWSCVLPIQYNSSVISLEQIVNLLNVAGFGVGIGEMRPEKKGGFTFGMFHVV